MTGRRQQRGAALVVVLSMLSMSLMLGLSGVSGSAVNERLAGNYRASVMAQNEAEAGLYAFNDELRGAIDALNNGQPPSPPVFNSNPSGFVGALRSAAMQARQAATPEQARAALQHALPGTWSEPGNISEHGRHRWRPVAALPEDDALLAGQVGLRIESEGYFGSEGDEAIRKVIGLVALPDMPLPPSRGLMSCEGIEVKGSGIIDSYDSRDGDYGGSNSRRSNIVVGTQTEGAEVKVTGASPIHGNVAASGRFTATGSGAVHGNVRGNDTISISGGGANIYGDVIGLGDVAITSSGTVHGDVQAAGTLTLGNWSSRIEGDALVAAVNSVRTAADQVGGVLDADSGGPEGLVPVFSVASAEDCEVPVQTARYGECLSQAGTSSGPLSMQGGPRNIVLDATGLHDPNNAVPDIGTPPGYDGKRLVRFDSLRLGGSANFQIGSAGNPVDMVMVVTGDIDIGGGGSFRIAEGSSLTIVTAGEFKLASAIEVGDGKPSRVDASGNVHPVLSVISVHDDAGKGKSGVFIGGAANFYGQIIAPYSQVEVTGSGQFYGEVVGRSIDIKGAGGFHYDEAFGDTEGGVGGGGVVAMPRLQGVWLD
ncbi:polymer-forming cytoskeletal protein [Billgrantia lactosivorans]|uniref:polymer-forming cytoskeletal protein n=1 Tax=Billgrantia lactosivorans TaxID=2185141 RepID=UPI000DAC87E5|nr:polymer-forming cytoskeletal protein [Halomonas lactosivorans]